MAAMKHPSSEALFRHWDERRGRGAVPERSDIDPGKLRPALGDIFILAFTQNGHSFRLAGTRVCALVGRELKGSGFVGLWEERERKRVAEVVRGAVDDSVGVLAAVRGTNSERQTLDLELLLLPLTHCGQTHLRVVGTLAPMTVPYWLGASPVRSLALGDFRFVGHRPDAQPPHAIPALGASAPRSRRTFTVYDGGRA